MVAASVDVASYGLPKTRIITPELGAFLAAVGRRESCKAPAFAGAGKTEALVTAAAAVAPRPMLVVMFNKGAVAGAKKRFFGKAFAHVTVTNWNSLGYQACGVAFRGRLTKSERDVGAAILRRYYPELQRLSYSAEKASDAVFQTILTYQRSRSEDLLDRHVPSKLEISAPAATVAAIARRVFAEMVDLESDFPVLHDTYMKLYQLSRPKLDFELIANDESQDIDPIALAILEQQQSQLIVVGDTHQSIYEWRNAVDAMDAFDLPEYPLSHSWRYGKEIADYVNPILASKGERRPIVGNPKVLDRVFARVLEGDETPEQIAESTVSAALTVKRSDVGEPDIILTRTNAGMFEVAASYAMMGRDVMMLRGAGDGTTELLDLVRGVYCFKSTGKSDLPELRHFKTWSALEDAAQSNRAGELAPFIKIVAKYGEGIYDLAEAITKRTSAAGINISTPFTAKGLEYDHVEIYSDYQPFCKLDLKAGRIVYNIAEANLAYVALTRAKRFLNVSAYDPIYRKSLAEAAQLGVKAVVRERQESSRKLREAAA